MKNYIYLFRYMLCIGLLMKVSICYSQEEYEYVNTSSWKWSSNSELLFYYNSTEKLLVANNNALTEEEKKQHSFTMRITGMDIPVKKGNSYTISFNIKNEHNPRLYKYKVNGVDKKGRFKEMWHETDIYWGLSFQCRDNYGNTKEFTQSYCYGKRMNNGYTYTSSKNSDVATWASNSDIDTRTFKIEYDGSSTVKIYGGYGATLLKTFYNTDGLNWIGIRCGSAAQILVTNFKMYRQTDYGAVLPEIIYASELIDKKNYSYAVSKLTNVLNTYKGALPYYYRARAYLGQDYCRSAIDDCNSGLSYNCDKELRENLYFIRGFCKLSLMDDTGVNDMRNAGEIGMRFLRENGLIDYVPGQSNKTPTTKNKSSNSGTVNRSTNRIPTLKKTN